MRSAAWTCALLFIGLVPGATAQQIVRDSQGVAIINRAVIVLGGSEIANVQNCVASGTFSTSAGSWLRYKSFVWKNAADQYRYEVTDASNTTIIDRSGHGTPTLEIAGQRQRRNDHSPINAAPAHLAALRLFQVLNDQKFDIIFDGSEVLDGRSVYKVKTRNNVNEIEGALTQQEWYFDQSGLPVRVEYQVGDQRNALDITKMAADLSGYEAIDGVLVPMQITFYMNGKSGGTATISNIVFNTSVSSSEFD